MKIGRLLACVSAMLLMSESGFAWTNDVFDQYLVAGKWSAAADDNADGETLPIAFVETIVKNYCQIPTNPDAKQDMGFLALTIGTTNWGVSGVPSSVVDPDDHAWKSTTGADAGKHLMSYAIGGLGILHGDVEDLFAFVSELSSRPTIPSEQRTRLRRLLDVNYELRHGWPRSRRTIVYDQLRAAGVCEQPQRDVDLNGKPFEHRRQTATEKYCDERENPALGPEDWQLFRTVAREALRTKDDQAWILKRWMDHYWLVSLAKVRPGKGYIEEVMINARIRNSNPSVANKALSLPGATPDERIKHALATYGEWKPKTLKRRQGVMMRSVVLYRHLAAKLKGEGVACP